MNILNKFKKISGVAAALIMLQSGAVSADSADNLQAALASGVYTIKYENVTPPSRNATPKEKTFLMQTSSIYTAGMSSLNRDFSDPYMAYKVIEGIATSNGEKQYCEFSSKIDSDDSSATLEYTSCSLTLNDETFDFKRTKDGEGKIQYSSTSGKNKVMAVPAIYNRIGFKNVNFGDTTVTRLMNVLMPLDRKEYGAPIYTKVKTGRDANGLEYADYKSNFTGANTTGDGPFLDVIRYYFKDGQLVKIYAGKYQRINGVVTGTRAIINVTEFKTTAEDNLLKLPAEIKDVTKRQDEE